MVKKFLKNEQNAHILFFAFVVICIAFTLSISRGILVKYDEMVYGQEVQELEEQITQTENLEKKLL